ncbi:MAG: hypothetical protein N3A38_09835, partial [Planctomycetota bacterium]|nr:hypothetical protein [Planctomycetota bacterium]
AREARASCRRVFSNVPGDISRYYKGGGSEGKRRKVLPEGPRTGGARITRECWRPGRRDLPHGRGMRMPG